ncbi:PRTRC system protein B [Pedobacter sp. ISL-68]|uniref:prokaryotic E2 ligase family D protein n=1 Tax=unclassified Pedobacter TaxID=2628915 RepID=UPI001BE7F240|nr:MULTISPECIES: prokaryotic E2 ligase family D protein [unclassified Pedobacter]MBT2560177.1 PRTRC system protein B [Pedobacter sp. ISL-64]MBT2589156.1 PRTRC system protein B [Pedobacter sp. ISL-68]
MTNVTGDFNDRYIPYKALLIYNCQKENDHNISTDEANSVYVESYDIGLQGNPINAHPLSLNESIALAELLQSSAEMQNGFLKSQGLLPNNLLYLKPDNNGFAVWYTPPQQREMFFVRGLGIPCARAYVPAMVWKAGRDSLCVFAVKGKSKPTAKTALYHAPYFNIYANGNVCMGNVNISIDRGTHLENFMMQWESYFFGSYFSHTINGGSRTNGNIVQLWQQQVATGNRFSDLHLLKNGLTLNQLIR